MKRCDRLCYRAGVATLLIVTALVTVSVTRTLAQEKVNITIDAVDASDFPRITAYATVLDTYGRAIVDLEEESFALWEDDTPVPDFAVDYRKNEAEPIALALALDTSESMRVSMDNTKIAATQLIANLGPADEVAVLSFSNLISPHIGFTSDIESAIAVVESLEAGGGTLLNDAIMEGVTLLDERPPGRKALIVLTDGTDDGSTMSIDFAISAAQDASIPVYVIGLGGLYDEDTLNAIAAHTGGHLYKTPTSDEINAAFESISELLRFRYVFHLTSSLPADEGSHQLRIEVDVGGIKADAKADFTAEAREVTVHILTPGDGEEIAEVVTLQVGVEAPADVIEVVYLLDERDLATVTSADFAYEWDTTGVPLGSHTLTVRATDSAGNRGEAVITVDVVKPVTIAFIAPPEESLRDLSDEVEVIVESWALYGIGEVAFFVDGERVGDMEAIEGPDPPQYRYVWDTTDWTTGEHTVGAAASDVNDVSVQVEQQVWIAFRGQSYGIWVALGVVLLAGGILIPLAARKRRSMQAQSRAGAGAAPGAAPTVGAPPARQTGPAVGWLIVEQGPEPGRRWPVTLGETSLGRSSASNAIVVPSRTASRRHAVIRADAGGFMYYDIQPTNPTLINGRQIVGSHELREGDRIRIGDVIMRFSKEEAK
jgi:VWFA-related protein